MDTFRYIVAVLCWISFPPSVFWWFVVHPFAQFWRHRGPTLTYWVLGVGYLLMAAGLYQVRDFGLATDYETNWGLVVAALPLLGVATFIGIQRKKYLTFKILAGVPEVQSDPEGAKLITEGIYSHIRHPRYVEASIGCVGWALIVNYQGIYVLTAATLLAIYLVVVIEEKELRQRFGEAYDLYAAQVPRFIPWRKSS